MKSTDTESGFVADPCASCCSAHHNRCERPKSCSCECNDAAAPLVQSKEEACEVCGEPATVFFGTDNSAGCKRHPRGWQTPRLTQPKFEGATPPVTNTPSDEGTKKSYLRDDHALQKERRQCDLITQQRDDFHAERNAERTRRFEADALIETLTYENEQLRALVRRLEGSQI